MPGSHQSQPGGARPQLKIVWDDGAGSATTPLSTQMRLSDFFWEWFKPNACEGEGKASGTIAQYKTTIHYWVQLTGDPPLAQVDQFTISQFAKGLRETTFTRSRTRDGRIMPGAAFQKLGPERIGVHLKNLRAIVNRLGEQRQANRPTAGLSLKRLLVPCPRTLSEPDDCFSLEAARRMVAAAERFQAPHAEGVGWPDFFRGYLSGLYVTGLRPGTVQQIGRSLFARKDDGWWIRLPAALVSKTGKGKWIALPDWCAEAMLNAGPGEEPFDCGVHRRTLHEYHKRLQLLAGMAEHALLPEKAWRRTHDAMMQRLGAGLARDVGQRTLDHAHHSTTTGHYFDITEELRRMLPPLWESPPPPVPTPPPDPQRRLFD